VYPLEQPSRYPHAEVATLVGDRGGDRVTGAVERIEPLETTDPAEPAGAVRVLHRDGGSGYTPELTRKGITLDDAAAHLAVEQPERIEVYAERVGDIDDCEVGDSFGW